MSEMRSYWLGTGLLYWDRVEASTRRYGYVYLVNEGESILAAHHGSVRLYVAYDIQRHYGQLIAVARTAVRVYQPADVMPDGHPSPPVIGEHLVLGVGWLAIGHTMVQNHPTVGIIPEPFRAQNWLDVRCLNKGIGQKVDLNFEELPVPVG